MKILGAVLELPAKQHCQSSPSTSKLAGSSQMATRILIFSIAMSANNTFYVKTIETNSRTFLALNILTIGMLGLFGGYLRK